MGSRSLRWPDAPKHCDGSQANGFEVTRLGNRLTSWAALQRAGRTRLPATSEMSRTVNSPEYSRNWAVSLVGMTDRTRKLTFGLSLTVALVFAEVGHADPWAVPPEGSCGEATEATAAEDAAARPPLVPGQVLSPEDALVLKAYLPPEIWARRDQLLWEGMRLEIGPCHRDYSPPAFYQEYVLAAALRYMAVR